MRSLTRFCLDYFPHSLAGHVQLRHCQMRHQCHTSHITCCHTFASTATLTLLLGICSCATAKCATTAASRSLARLVLPGSRRRAFSKSWAAPNVDPSCLRAVPRRWRACGEKMNVCNRKWIIVSWAAPNMDGSQLLTGCATTVEGLRRKDERLQQEVDHCVLGRSQYGRIPAASERCRDGGGREGQRRKRRYTSEFFSSGLLVSNMDSSCLHRSYEAVQGQKGEGTEACNKVCRLVMGCSSTEHGSFQLLASCTARLGFMVRV